MSGVSSHLSLIIPYGWSQKSCFLSLLIFIAGVSLLWAYLCLWHTIRLATQYGFKYTQYIRWALSPANQPSPKMSSVSTAQPANTWPPSTHSRALPTNTWPISEYWAYLLQVRVLIMSLQTGQFTQGQSKMTSHSYQRFRGYPGS